MFDNVISILIGVLLGTFTGLIPGVHPNTLVFLFITFTPFLLQIFSVENIVAISISMAITHSFTSFIPSVFLSAPEESTSLSILPGHRMLMRGEGFEAVRLSVVGGINATFFLLILLPIIIIFIEYIYNYVRKFIFIILIVLIIYLVLVHKNKLNASLIVIYSGILGYLSLNITDLRSDQVLLAMFTGLFALSTIFVSIKSGVREIPKQKITTGEKEYYRESFLSAISSLFLSIVPSISPSQIILLVQNAFRIYSSKSYMVLIGGITTADAIVSILSLYLIGNPRSGVSIFVEKFMGEISFSDFIFILSCIFISIPIAGILTLEISKYFLKILQRLNYYYLNIIIFIFLLLIIYIASGFLGVLVAVTSASLGILCHYLNVQKSLLVTTLIVPTIIYYFPF